MQYFAFRWLSLLLSQVSKNIHQLFCRDYNELIFLGVSSAWCAQPLGRSPDGPDQVECTQLFVLSNFLICPKTRQFLTRSDLLIQTCAAMVFLVIWLYLSFSFKINSHHEIGAGQHQHKRLCFQHENVTGVNIWMYAQQTISTKIAKLIQPLQNYPPIDVRLIIEKARQLSTWFFSSRSCIFIQVKRRHIASNPQKWHPQN